MRRQALAAALALLLLATGCPSAPPDTLEGWLEHLPTIDRDEEALSAGAEAMRRLARARIDAGEDLSGLIPQITPLLEGRPVIRAQAAWLLGVIGDPSAVDALADAIDYGAGRGVDAQSRALNAANIRIAEALGRIGTEATVAPLVRLTRAREPEEALAAVEALGVTGRSAAVPRLSELAVADDVSPFISRRAIEALGAIGHADGLPALMQMLFKERQGVSFYRESSFAVFQLGADAGPQLIAILDGQNPEFMEWAKENGVREEAVYAKAAQILGDLADNRAAPALMRRLAYESEYADMRLIPRMFAAEALGRLRHPAAVRRLAAMLDEEEANARERYIQSLVMIGDRAAVPALIRSATVSRNYDAREYSLRGLARLGGAGTLARFDATLAQAARLSECQSWFEGDAAAIERRCTERIGRLEERSKRFRPMLEAAEECKSEVSCWLEKLSDENARVREKAAWELGWSGDAAAALTPLLAAAQEEELEARFAILVALDVLLFGAANDKVPPEDEGRRAIDRLESILADERGRVQFVRINEDVKRLELKVRRAFMQKAGEIEDVEAVAAQ
jgi:HEAT repeat protein